MDRTASQTLDNKMEDLLLFFNEFVDNKKKIQIFGVNMTFISSRGVKKKCIFHSW